MQQKLSPTGNKQRNVTQRISLSMFSNILSLIHLLNVFFFLILGLDENRLCHKKYKTILDKSRLFKSPLGEKIIIWSYSCDKAK